MSKDAAFGAIFALVGAVVGALLSFLPLYLFSWKDKMDRNAGIVALLQTERRTLIDYCNTLGQAADPSDSSGILTVHAPSTPAWDTASTQGDLISAIGIPDWTTFNAACSSVGMLRGLVAHYVSFTSTQQALSGFPDSVRSLNATLYQRSTYTRQRFQELDRVLDPLQARFELGSRLLSVAIWCASILGIGAVTLFGYFAWSSLRTVTTP